MKKKGLKNFTQNLLETFTNDYTETASTTLNNNKK